VYWTPSVDDVEVEGYEVFVNGVLKGTSSTLSLNITGLDANQTYSITVRAYDATGNKSNVSKVYSASTYAEADTIAPSAPLNASAFNIGVTSFDVTWNASTDNKKVVGYEVYKDGVKVGTTVETVFSLTGLDPLTTYDITIKAIDASGNTSAESSILEVTTLGDTTKPEIPSDLSASNVSGTQLTLNWSPAKDNVAVSHYEVFKDGVKIEDNVTNTSFTVENLDLKTSYDFSVKAVDEEGNTSDESLDLEVTTTDDADQGPVVDFTEINQSTFADQRTVVKFNVGEAGFMTLNIKDASGKIIHKGPQNSRIDAGGRNIPLNVRALKDGVYTIEVAMEELDGGKTMLYRTLVIDHIAPKVTAATASNITELPTSTQTTGKTSNIQYTLDEDAEVTIQVFDSANKLVATLLNKAPQTKGVNSVQWNGYNRFNQLVADGKYSVTIRAVDKVKLASKALKLNVTVERSAPTISGVTLTPSTFQLSSSGKMEIGYTLGEASKVTIDILQSDGTTLVRNVVKDLARTAGSFKVIWTGTNSMNLPVAEGNYVYRIRATDASGKSTTVTGNISVTK
jgi:chitodextrinase/flagellar hook assembly protein FlgD